MTPTVRVASIAVSLVTLGCSELDLPEPWRASTTRSDIPTEHSSHEPSAVDAAAQDEQHPSPGSSKDSGATDQPVEVLPPFQPAQPLLPKLTRAQYVNIVRDLFGPGLTVPELDPDQRPYGFSNIGAAQATISERGVDLYQRAAFTLAGEAFRDPQRRMNVVSCQPATPLDEPCLSQFLEDFGRRVFRRPLASDEASRYKQLAKELAVEDPWQTLEYLTATLLQSPNFLYRAELGEPDPDHEGWRRYTSYEMASRLSFLLRNSAPDRLLLAAAGRGELDTADGVISEARRLLEDRAASEQLISELYTEYLDLFLLEKVVFPKEMNPSGTLAQAMRDEVLEMVKQVALRDGDDMRTLFTTRQFVPSGDLAALYGMEPVDEVSKRRTLPSDSPRGGIFTTGALLTLHGRPTRTSPTVRGLFVRQRLLCGTVPPPPPGIPEIKESETASGETIREKLEQHRSDPACAGCHRAMDPIGLGMEDFDQFGRHRSLYENGAAIDAAGDLDGKPFNGARELGPLLAEDPRVMACLVKQLYRFASGHLEQANEIQPLRQIERELIASGYQLEPLLLALVASDAFRYTVEAAE